MSHFFITGTDTEVGKTYVTSRLLQAAAKAGKRSIGYKPVSAGCEQISGEWVNEDALSLQQASSIRLPLSDINPIALKEPIAPHIAAEKAGISLSHQDIRAGYQNLCAYQPDTLLMEGAGGWRLPLGNGEYLSDTVKSLGLDVILVVGMRLGCLNHALLTAEAIRHDGLNLTGWIANQLSPDMPMYRENLHFLQQALPEPLLLEMPYNNAPDSEQLRWLIEQIT